MKYRICMNEYGKYHVQRFLIAGIFTNCTEYESKPVLFSDQDKNIYQSTAIAGALVDYRSNEKLHSLNDYEEWINLKDDVYFSKFGFCFRYIINNLNLPIAFYHQGTHVTTEMLKLDNKIMQDWDADKRGEETQRYYRAWDGAEQFISNLGDYWEFESEVEL